MIEERLCAFGGEVGRQARALCSALGPSCVVAQVLDLEGPDPSAGLLVLARHQAHPWHAIAVVVDPGVLVLEHGPQPRLVNRARVVQRGLHPVAHESVQRVVREVLAAQLPVLRRVALTFDDGQPVLAHELVVRGLHAVLAALIRTVVEGPVVLERATGFAVVIDDQDVVVRVSALAVDVGHHEGVRVGVHLLRQGVPEVVHPLEVLGGVRVELVGGERLSVVQRLHRSTMSLGKGTSGAGPRPGRARDVARDRDAPGVVSATDVGLRRGCRATR